MGTVFQFIETSQVKREEADNRLVYELGNHQWDLPELRALLKEIVTKQTQFESFEVELDSPSIGVKTMLLNARQSNQHGNKSKIILLAIEDIATRRESERQIRALNERILSAHEEERSRVAGELHDSIGQSLAAM